MKLLKKLHLLYTARNGDFPVAPVELHVLTEPFEESGATWSKNKNLTNWTDIGAGIPTSTNSNYCGFGPC